MKLDTHTIFLIILALGIIYFIFNRPKTANVVYSYQTTATALSTSGALDVGSAGGCIILIPNEGHHGPDDSQTQFPNPNSTFTPLKAVIPTGCDVVFLSDDPGHTHTITMGAMGSTKSISVDGSSTPIKFTTPGTYEITSKSYASAGQKGSIQVTATRAVPGKVVGAFWVPAADQQRFKTAMSTAGCTVLSSAPGSRKSSGQSVTDHMLLVYSATGTAAAVAQKLATVTKMTPYT